jgi:predicted AAA+ superfamily ATPase
MPHKELNRYINPSTFEISNKEIVLLEGPLGSGKSTLARKILNRKRRKLGKHYLDWNTAADRTAIRTHNLPATSGLICFDDLHRYPTWPHLVLDLWNNAGKMNLLIAGSAKLDQFCGEEITKAISLKTVRLHPLSYTEIKGKGLDDLQRLLTFGGFPEPYLQASKKFTRKWRQDLFNTVLWDEICTTEKIHNTIDIETLLNMLPDHVGHPLRVNSLTKKLSVSHRTVSRWLQLFEKYYLIFRLSPYTPPGTRSVKKEVKHYHYDWTVVKDKHLRFENMLACHLLKWCHFQQDFEGNDFTLLYYRDIDGREVDFVILKDGHPVRFIDCCTPQQKSTRSLKYLKNKFPKTRARFVSLNDQEDDTFDEEEEHVDGSYNERAQAKNTANEDTIKFFSAIDFLKNLV